LDFWRNGFVSFASVLMMVFTLFIIGLAIFTGVILNTTLQQFRDKADMNVYFTTDATEDQILTLQKTVAALPEVASTQYVSADDALANFRELHQNDQLTLQALDQLGGNPLGAVLNVKAKDISQYGVIANFLQQQEALQTGQPQIIDKINYFDADQQNAINRLAQITDSSKWIGVAIILIFVAITIAISFNTLRLAIYTSREEISVMRLVGAGQGYIRAPFLVEGILYGLIAGMITMLLFYPLTWWLGSSTQNFFGGINVFSYYLTNFPLLFLIIVGSGVLLGAIASYLAVRRYLKI
ncbi:MAG: ABC transporter permease, partial [Patescibacteria group bacterium]|nr:ABC transporter permease [Patescibacteria group bacterium]